MAKPVTLNVGQYLLLMVSLLGVGAGGGAMATALVWHVRGGMLLAFPLYVVGMGAFSVLSVWKTLEGRDPAKPLYF
jgi:hypothetical protein